MLPVAKRLDSETKANKANKQKIVTNNSDMHKFSPFPETYFVFDNNSEKLSSLLLPQLYNSL